MAIVIFCSVGLHSPLVIFGLKHKKKFSLQSKSYCGKNSCETVKSCNVTFAGVTKADKAV